MKFKHKFVDALLVLHLWMAIAFHIEGKCTEKGWFGLNCTLKCRCVDEFDCDKVSGECGPNKECQPGWFGPGCQYVTWWWGGANAPFLTDGNKSTCNPDSNATALNITWNWWDRTNWIRIHTNIDMSSYPLEFEPGNGKCTNKKLYRFSETILDIDCMPDDHSNKFYLRGRIVGHICHIDMTQGRNLAIRQKAYQSSNYQRLDLSKVQAINAVDGTRMDTCMELDRVRGRPWWKVELSFEAFLKKIIIYSSPKYAGTFNKIAVETYFANNKKNYGIFTDDCCRPVITLEVNQLKGRDVGKRIEICIEERFNVNDNFFSLCEVEVFGEYLRLPGKWGFFNEESCKCGPHESCSQVTGLCASPCFDPGQVLNATTLKCAYPCRPNCVSAVCQGEGSCPLCVVEQCLVCRTGFSGTFCKQAQDCPNGTFGENCTSQCSSNCSDSLCNPVTGVCLACPKNRVMPQCFEKDLPKKDKEKEKEFDYTNLFSLSALLPVFCCLYCCLCGKKRKEAAGNTKNPEDQGAEEKALSEERLSQTGSSVDS